MPPANAPARRAPRRPPAARRRAPAPARPRVSSEKPPAATGEERRARVLDAARRVFEAKGLEDTQMRAIAEEAGYTVGALYFYYKSKEEIYADLLSASLGRLHEATRLAGADAATAGEKAAARALAFYDYYVGRPDEITLGLYLFQGIRPRGLTRDLNRQLNAKFWDALAEIQAALVEGGADRETALRDTTALFAHCVGVLVLIHTGRLRMFGQDGREMFADYVRALTWRAGGILPNSELKNAPGSGKKTRPAPPPTRRSPKLSRAKKLPLRRQSL